MPNLLEPLLSPKELAALCKVPVGTVYRWNSEGTGPRARVVGRHVRYSAADVSDWLDRQAK